MNRLIRPALIAAALVLGVSMMLVPLGTRVWAGPSLVAWPAHDGFMVALLAAGCVVYTAVSVMLTRLAAPPAARRSRGMAE